LESRPEVECVLEVESGKVIARSYTGKSVVQHVVVTRERHQIGVEARGGAVDDRPVLAVLLEDATLAVNHGRVVHDFLEVTGLVLPLGVGFGLVAVLDFVAVVVGHATWLR